MMFRLRRVIAAAFLRLFRFTLIPEKTIVITPDGFLRQKHGREHRESCFSEAAV